MPRVEAFVIMNLQYEVRICHKIHNKCTMNQYYLSFSESGTDVTIGFNFFHAFMLVFLNIDALFIAKRLL